LFAPCIYGVVLRARSVRGEPRNQRNASGEVATAQTTPTNTKQNICCCLLNGQLLESLAQIGGVRYVRRFNLSFVVCVNVVELILF